MNVFKLEAFLGRYEFTAPYLLCCSDAESFTMQEVISMAGLNERALWDDLRLGYTEAKGSPILRQQIVESLYPSLDVDNVLTFAGAEDGIFCALKCLCVAGDHVIALTPCYQSLTEIPALAGADITTIPLWEEGHWRVDVAAIQKAIRPNTKCVVINFPHNPTGQVITQGELDELIKLLDYHGIWLFSDEVYRLLGTPKEPWAKPVAERYSKGMSLGVMSKAFGMAGLRVGWIACQDKEMLTRLQWVKDYTSICNSAPSEILSLIALKNMDQILARNNGIVDQNLNLLDGFFNEFQHLFSWVRPQGGCVGFVKYKAEESVDVLTGRLVDDRGVLIMPASIYDYQSNYFRIGFGRKNMPEALARFADYIK